MIGISRIVTMCAAAVLCFGGGSTTLREGTPVAVGFAAGLSSKTASKGDSVGLVLVSDMAAGGVIVAKAGCKVLGHVAAVKKAAPPGRSGALNVQLDYLEVGNEKVRLRGSKDNTEDSDIHYSRPSHLKWPMGLLRTGDDIEIRPGTTLTVYLAEDISLPAVQ